MPDRRFRIHAFYLDARFGGRRRFRRLLFRVLPAYGRIGPGLYFFHLRQIQKRSKAADDRRGHSFERIGFHYARCLVRYHDRGRAVERIAGIINYDIFSAFPNLEPDTPALNFH